MVKLLSKDISPVYTPIAIYEVSNLSTFSLMLITICILAILAGKVTLHSGFALQSPTD